VKRAGTIQSPLHGSYAFDLHNPAPAKRYEVRLTRGSIGGFLLGTLAIDENGEYYLTLSASLGVSPTTVGPHPDLEFIIERAINRWHEMRAVDQSKGAAQ
jgi:hypothetical protein